MALPIKSGINPYPGEKRGINPYPGEKVGVNPVPGAQPRRPGVPAARDPRQMAILQAAAMNAARRARGVR